MKRDWRQSVLYIAAIGMEGCWLYALLSLLNRQAAGGRLSVIGILLLFPLAFVFNTLLQRLRWHRFALRGISWLAWAVGMLLIVKVQLFAELPLSNTEWLLAVPRSIAEVIYTFKPELLILLSTSVLWWLGRRLALRAANFAAQVTEFQFGLVMLVITFLIGSQLSVGIGNTVPIALTFFFFALAGISVAHALEGTGWLSGLYQGHWSGLLLISISFILILGLLISAVVTPELLQLVWAGIKWAWGYVWGVIMTVMAFLASLFPEPEPVELPPMPSMPAIEPAEEHRLWTMPEAVRSGLRIGWTVMVVGFLLFALWRVSSDIFRWLRRRLAGMAGAEFEPLPGAFRADLLGLLKRILFKLLRLRLPHLAAQDRPVLPEIASVRQVYRHFLRWAASGGYPRQTSQTPHEYCYALVGLVPELQSDLDLITQQYVTTRYGASLPTEKELHRLNQTWHRVKRNHLKQTNREHMQK